MKRSVASRCAIGLVGLLTFGVASAFTPEEMQGIENGVMFRRAFVERAATLRAQVPNELRARILLTLPDFVFNGKVIVGADPELPTLVDLARGSTDPMVLALLVERCGNPSSGSSPCDALDMATRWVEADTQNQAAWLTLGQVHQTRKDETTATATFMRAAQASVWRDAQPEIERYLVRLLPKDLSAESRSEALLTISAVAAASGMPRTSLLSAECKKSGSEVACHRILAAMFDGADSLVAIAVSTRFSAGYGVSDAIVQQRYQRYDAMTTAARRLHAPDGPTATAADRVRFNEAFEARLVLGELAVLRADLKAAGLSEAQAATSSRIERVAREKRRDESEASHRQRVPG